MESILTSIKKLLGITEECKHFDLDIIIHINTVFMELNQLGVGPNEGFPISDSTTIWNDYLTDNSIEAVKSFMYLKVKMLFDPNNLSSAVIDSINRSINELTWRITHQAEMTRPSE